MKQVLDILFEPSLAALRLLLANRNDTSAKELCEEIEIQHFDLVNIIYEGV